MAGKDDSAGIAAAVAVVAVAVVVAAAEIAGSVAATGKRDSAAAVAADSGTPQ